MDPLSLEGLFPTVSVPRGGIRFPDPPTPAEQAAADALRSMVTRAVDQAVARRNELIEQACRTATEHGWDVHVHEHPARMLPARDVNQVRMVGYVGIRYTPAEHGVPTLHMHSEDYSWTDDEDWTEGGWS